MLMLGAMHVDIGRRIHCINVIDVIDNRLLDVVRCCSMLFGVGAGVEGRGKVTGHSMVTRV